MTSKRTYSPVGWYVIENEGTLSVENRETFPTNYSMCRGPFPTKKAALDTLENPKLKRCRICKRLINASYMETVKKRLLRNSHCFDCDFWQEHICHRDDPIVARINGKHYRIAPETDDPKQFRGFGGTMFHIRFFDGRVVTTTNLWSQGDIPERFRKELPDNAVFSEI